MPAFFHVPSTPTEGHPASLLWSRGACCGNQAPRPATSSAGLAWGLFINLSQMEEAAPPC